jgi:hypothetical protein
MIDMMKSAKDPVLSDYQMALLVMPIGLFIASLVSTLLLKETYHFKSHS